MSVSPAIHLLPTLHLIRENVPSNESKITELAECQKIREKAFFEEQTKDEMMMLSRLSAPFYF